MAERTERLSVGHTAKETMDYRLIFAAAFVAFLLEAIGRRLLVRVARMSQESGDRSVIAEARAAACKYVPFAFMG
ncbi:hypothetical protein [Rhodoplanes roseus]|uniref:Uncharacterized protein n=1 Tax=Rhodoplanes roseus TaxID=29409 RepID=A0A327L468_9BRAD|nr:hypothetical protein [Rhodoplanes roseus]RAI45207.1 hypothetical protein CH341_05050 [Rhodoplanes roseus]